MDIFIPDLRYAARNLLHARGFTAVAILTLALGIGATTAMFTVVNSVLLRPLPYREPQRLVEVAGFNTERPVPEMAAGSMSYPDFEDVVSRNRSFSSLAAFRDDESTLTGAGDALYTNVEMISAGTFQLLGVQPSLGRSFLPNEDEPGHHVAIISHSFWRTHFNAEKSAVDRSIALNGRPYTIVGVAAPGFQFPVRAHARDLWITFSQWHETDDPGDKTAAEQRGYHSLEAIARLGPGVTLPQANSDLTSIYRALAAEYPDSNSGVGIAAVPELQYMVGETRKPLLILLGAVGLVLLIASGNIANLLLARSTGRGREIAIRAALGASRLRVIRQLVSESVLLSLAGGALGAALASWALAAVLKVYPENLPRATEIGIDHNVLLFAAVLAVVTGVLFGILPAWRVSAPNLSEAMREGGRTSTVGPAHNRLRSALVVAQTALGVMLLIGAGLLIRSLQRLARADLGLNPSHLLTANFGLSETRYKPDQMDQFIRTLLDRLRTLPGVTAAAGTMPLPLGGSDGWSVSFDLLDHPVPKAVQPSAGIFVVTNGYLEAMQIPLIRGRRFDERDQRNGAPVLIITESFARKFFPTEDPLGRKIEIGGGEGSARASYKTREIIGIVGDIRTSNLAKAPVPAYYVPLSQLMWGPPTLVIRTAGDPKSIAPAIAAVLRSMEPETPLYDVHAMEDLLALDLGRARFQAMLLGLFAGIALLLTAIGLYGVIAYSVAQRTHEIGVRMALGASRSGVLSMVLGRGLQLTAAGLVMGVAGALALARIIAALLYEIPPRDPATYVVVCITLSFVALLASYVPALRAARVQPTVALRYE